MGWFPPLETSIETGIVADKIMIVSKKTITKEGDRITPMIDQVGQGISVVVTKIKETQETFPIKFIKILAKDQNPMTQSSEMAKTLGHDIMETRVSITMETKTQVSITMEARTRVSRPMETKTQVSIITETKPGFPE